ncbi:hypothetical protein U0C82_15345 [Fulvimarina sp. 2208YS6-2-32]|uniref:Uncharacterized protein n=1 Tax=Fulvimarina uroteuthidis TaxID=3098149 RepID=A0ABU5I5M7_9HYPH|nr:hypothetical protein [Fulvimarina sp. 2208YS6-2-32]MDY8110516.1 hypothetical protein [Fulvimarina sp. 2208YS6-2-32]
MLRFLLGGAIATLMLATPTLADPSGVYAVSGYNPDGSSYEGEVLVSRVGDTFALSYTIGDDTFTGTALGDDEVLAVGYTSGNDDVGVALMVESENGFEGVWTFLGSKTMAVETWTAQQ